MRMEIKERPRGEVISNIIDTSHRYIGLLEDCLRNTQDGYSSEVISISVSPQVNSNIRNYYKLRRTDVVAIGKSSSSESPLIPVLVSPHLNYDGIVFEVASKPFSLFAQPIKYRLDIHPVTLEGSTNLK